MSADTPRRAARRAAVHAHDSGQVRMATQERHPFRSTLRTMVQALAPLVMALPVILPVVQQWLDENRGGAIPESAYAVVLPGITALAALSALISRLMAIPAVNVWLRRWVPPLAPDG